MTLQRLVATYGPEGVELRVLYPAGPVLNVGGAKTLISWDRLVLCELVED
jgi:hypothetical protein